MSRFKLAAVCALIISCGGRPAANSEDDTVSVVLDTVTTNPEESIDHFQNEKEGEPYGETQVVQCVFQGLNEAGKCTHLEFSCGDFGAANTKGLSKEDRLLWQKLIVENEEGEKIANPVYLGQKFTIAHNLVKQLTCTAGSGPQLQEVPNLVAFRLN